jgi:hypothetical protein
VYQAARNTNFFNGTQPLWILNLGLASCKPAGTQNFQIALGFIENLYTPCFSQTASYYKFMRLAILIGQYNPEKVFQIEF